MSKSKHHSSYYRSTLSFRTDHDHYKTLNSTQLNSDNSSITSNDSDINLNSCDHKTPIKTEYFSYSYFLSQLPKSYELNSHHLFDSLNIIVQILKSNSIDCQTLRLKSSKIMNINFSDINIYTTRKSSVNQFMKNFELIGKYSSIQDDYQSCHTIKRKDLSRTQQISPPRIYYITSLFDEPFLMLRKRTALDGKYNQPQADLKELRGHVFDFDELEGFCVDLAEQVCSVLNITCKFRIVHDGGFGSKNATTGRWNGEKNFSKKKTNYS